MHSGLLQKTFFILFVISNVYTLKAQHIFTQKAADFGIDLDGEKDGGFSFNDLNNDGYVDLIVNTYQDDANHRTRVLFFNPATNQFEDVTASHCKGCFAEQEGSSVTERSLIIADFNNDGFYDFVRNNSKRLDVFLNNGEAAGYTFGVGADQKPNFFLYTTDLTSNNPPNGIPEGMNTEGIGVLDYDNDGLLDLFIENHNWGMEIYRNTGDASSMFEYISPEITGLPAGQPATVLDKYGKRINGDYSAITDFNDDGYIDIVARKSDGIAYDLMQRDPNGAGFINGIDLQDADNDNKGAVAFHDFDNDGDFDLVWTEAQRTVLYENIDGNFQEILPAQTGLDVSSGFVIDGVAAGDIDNDGDLDIFLTDSEGASFLFINQLTETDGVAPFTFIRDNKGINVGADGEGCMFVDFDNDGDLDLYINIKDGKNQYWENNLNDAAEYPDYVKVNVFENRIASASSSRAAYERYALGATITIKDICGELISGVREVNGGNGHGTQDPSKVHFTLPGISKRQYVLNVKYPVYNGTRKEVNILVEPGTTSVDVYPDTESISFEDLEFNLSDDDFTVLTCIDTPTVFNLFDNDTLLFCPEESLKLIKDSEYADVSLDEEGKLTYILTDSSFTGTDTLAYELQCISCDEKIDTAYVYVTVSDGEGKLVLQDDISGKDFEKFNTCADSVFTFDVVANDTIEDCALTTFEILTQPTYGTASIDAEGMVTFSLTDASYTGTDTLSYMVTCESCSSLSDTATVVIELVSEDGKLVLQDDSSEDFGKFNTCVDSVFTIDVVANDTIEDCALTTFEILTQPTYGTASIDSEGMVIFSLTDASYTGTDTLSYMVTCESCSSLSDTATVVIELVSEDGKLVLQDDSSEDFGKFNTCADSVFTFDVVANDTIEDCALTTFEILTQPTYGTASIDSEGMVTFSLTDASYTGTDTLSYMVTCESCSSLSDTATVVIELISEDGKLVLQDDSSEDFGKFNTCADSVFTFDVVANDTIEDCASTTFEILTQPTYGTASIDSEGMVTLSFTDASYTGTDTLSYMVTCESCSSLSDTATVVIELISEDGKLVLQDDSSEDFGKFNTCADSVFTFDVVVNDTIEDCALTTFEILTQPTYGTASIDSEGMVTFSLIDASYTGTDTLSYMVTCESCSSLSDTATVVIELISEDGKLVLQDDSSEDFGKFNTCADSVFTFYVVANDTIEDCALTTFEILTQPTYGMASIDSEGMVTFSLTDASYTGTDTLSYMVTCESCSSLSDTATVVIELVNGDSPITIAAKTFTKSCDTDEVISGSLDLENILAQCDSSYISITKPAAYGTAEIDQYGIFTYNLLSDTYNGIDTITYEVYCQSCEDQLVTASVYVEIDCEDSCGDIEVEDVTFEMEACGNQLTDQLEALAECETTEYTTISQPVHGTFNFISNDGTFTYTLTDLDFDGIDSVNYEIACVKDCGEKSATATIYFDLTNNDVSIPVITKLLTPNGDGYNDYLKINNIECYPVHTFKVFNRWGNLIFETNDYANNAEQAWYGQVNKSTGITPGTLVGDGTYFCVLELGNGNDISEYVEIRGSNR